MSSVEPRSRRRKRTGERLPVSEPTRQADYYDDDVIDDKLYNGACSLGQFCLNPCLCLYNLVVRWLRWYQRQDKKTKHRIRIVGALVVGCVCVLTFFEYQQFKHHPLRPRSDREVNSKPILLKCFDFSKARHDIGGWIHPTRDRKFASYNRLPVLEVSTDLRDYGGIEISTFGKQRKSFERQIAVDDSAKYDKERFSQLKVMDRGSVEYRTVPDDEIDQQQCRRPKWRSNYFPNCNIFHETDLSRELNVDWLYDPNVDSYLFSHGYYRDAWMIKDLELGYEAVWKTLRFKHDFVPKSFVNVQRDAVVMELLTASDYIVDIYGHCGTTTSVQVVAYEVEEYIVPDGYIKQEKLDAVGELDPKNDYSAVEKLEMAVTMSESLAVLHGFEGGPIVHDDVQLCQWLRTRDNRLVLGDFNRATILSYDEEEGEYCSFNNGYGYGNYRSPEEFDGGDLNEKIDVFSMGNNLYGLLTGLWPFYENEDDGEVQKMLVGGDKAFIDPRYKERSPEEAALVEAIERCWVYEPEERIDMFDLVKLLRKALEQSKKRHGTEENGNPSYPGIGGGEETGEREDALREDMDARGFGLIYSKDA